MIRALCQKDPALPALRVEALTGAQLSCDNSPKGVDGTGVVVSTQAGAGNQLFEL